MEFAVVDGKSVFGVKDLPFLAEGRHSVGVMRKSRKQGFNRVVLT